MKQEMKNTDEEHSDNDNDDCDNNNNNDNDDDNDGHMMPPTHNTNDTKEEEQANTNPAQIAPMNAMCKQEEDDDSNGENGNFDEELDETINDLQNDLEDDEGSGVALPRRSRREITMWCHNMSRLC